MWYEKTNIVDSFKWIQIFNDENQGLKDEDWELDRVWEVAVNQCPDFITIELNYDQEFTINYAYFLRRNLKNPKLRTFFCPNCYKYSSDNEQIFFSNSPILKTNKIIKSNFEIVTFKNSASEEIKAYMHNEILISNTRLFDNSLWHDQGCTLLSYFIEEEHSNVIFINNEKGFEYSWKYPRILKRFKLELNKENFKLDVIDKNQIIHSESLKRFFTGDGFYNRYYEIVSYLNNLKKLNLNDKNDI